MLELVTGKTKYFCVKRMGAPPTKGYDCHESPTHLEFFVWDQDTLQQRACLRLLPRWAVEWKAVKSRFGVLHDA